MRLFLAFILLSRLLAAQSHDSLINELVQIASDTERVNQLYKHGFDIRNSDPAYAYRLAKACEEQALKAQSKKHLAKSYNLLGILFYKRADYTKALQYHRQALALRQEAQDKLGIAISQTNLGNIYTDLHYYKLAEASYLDALKQYNELHNTLQTARCLINLGVLKHEQKQNTAAVQNFKEALKLGNALADYEVLAICNNNIGEVMAEQGQLDTAMLYVEEGLKMRNLLDNEVEMADSYLNMAYICIKKGQYNEASDYLGLAEKIADAFGYLQAKVLLYKHRAELYRQQHDFEKAYECLQKGDALKDSLQNIEKENLIFLDDDTPASGMQQGPQGPFRNLWLLVGCVAMALIIPLILIRYKR